jgi:DNA topoisomerase-1
VGRLHLKTARSGGAFIGCDNYPDCRYTRALAGGEEGSADGKVLGHDPDGLPVSVRTGRFGPYVQKGDATAENPKPPRASLPKGWSADTLTLERALMLLDLPRLIGPHPETKEPVEAGIGRFGPYIKHGATYANIPDVEEVFTIGMNRAVEVLAQKAARGPRAGAAPAQPLRALGDHPDGGAVVVMPGRYGPYLKWEKVNATLPKDLTPEAVSMERALEILAEKAGKAGTGKRKSGGAARAASKPKAPAKPKAATKKAPAKAAAKPAAKPAPRGKGAAGGAGGR